MPSTRPCPACHAPTARGARWCGRCGGPLPDAASAPGRLAADGDTARGPRTALRAALLAGVGVLVLGAASLLGPDPPERDATGTAAPLDDGEVALPAPGTDRQPSRSAGGDGTGSGPDVTSGSDGPGRSSHPAELVITCHLSDDCERLRVTSTTGFPLELAALDSRMVASDGAVVSAFDPEEVTWLTPFGGTPGTPQDPADAHPTSLVVAGGHVLATSLDRGLHLIDDTGSVRVSRGDLGTELSLDDLRLREAAPWPGRVLVAVASALSPSLGPEQFADRAREATQVVALDPDTLEVLDRSVRAPDARLVQGLPLLAGRIEGESALDPQDLLRSRWQAQTRRPGTGPGRLLDRIATIDTDGLELRDPVTGASSLRLEGSSWSIVADLGDQTGVGAVAIGTDPRTGVSTAHGIGPAGQQRWRRPLAGPCCTHVLADAGAGTVWLIDEDAAIEVVALTTGTTVSRRSDPRSPRPLAVRDELRLVAGTDDLEIRDPAGRLLASVSGEVTALDVPAEFTRPGLHTIALRTEVEVVVLAFTR